MTFEIRTIERFAIGIVFASLNGVSASIFAQNPESFPFVLTSILIGVLAPIAGWILSSAVRNAEWFRRRSSPNQFVDGFWLLATDLEGKEPDQDTSKSLAPGIWQIRPKNHQGELNPTISRLDSSKETIGYKTSVSQNSFVNSDGEYVNRARTSGKRSTEIIAIGKFLHGSDLENPDTYRGKVVLLDNGEVWEQSGHKITDEEIATYADSEEGWKDAYLKAFQEKKVRLRK
ncbi:MAG: hypothetical protein AAFP79_14990 [Pseudomonadota bacterium]